MGFSNERKSIINQTTIILNKYFASHAILLSLQHLHFIRGDTFSKGVTPGALKGLTSGVLQSVSSKKLISLAGSGTSRKSIHGNSHSSVEKS